MRELKTIKFRLHCPQLGLWAGLGGLQIVPCASQSDPRIQIFDGRDNETAKLAFYTVATGIKWELQLCAS